MNIVTIDFDIIMEPSISFYNNLINIDDESAMEDYIDKFSFLTNIPANFYIYDYLTRYIVRAAKQCKEIYFIDNHSDIIKIFDSITVPSEEVKVFNIDHHHDIGYDMDNIDWVKPIKTANVGNWVKYCKDRRFFSEYYWIHNENSDMYPESAKRYINEDFNLKDFDLDAKDHQPDILIICASYEWVPPVYHGLYLTWNSICSEINGKEYPLDTI